ncbi:Putative Alpha-glucosidase (Fragment) [Aspergillus calidoustus]|uniref:Putative Alpha-glucosidase n=1 Tax=Aspergillus calidoustus TaxID=454130 RepID=A0A0U5CHL6_ASPCI
MAFSKHTRQWWKEAVVYQIYPASFCDSNGDGIGDLPGITSKLDYLVDLGVNVIWVSPMYESPQVDMGYDISNYEAVHPPYGTVEDMEILIRETHARGMKLMLDLVINHTSDQHEWFKESRSSKDNPKRAWYIWRPPRYSPEGKRLPPNNWRAAWGPISAWEWDEATQEYYFHIFAAQQPDLNWENPETRKAIYASAMEFWLKRGVDGFRIDVVNMYSKPPAFPDAPIVDPSMPYQPASALFCNGPRMHEFLDEMGEILTRYGAITVGELPNTPNLQDVLGYVSAKSNKLSMVFQFEVVTVGMGTDITYDARPHNFGLPGFKQAVDATQSLIRNTDGWTTVFLENHDQARSISRFANDSPEFRVCSAKMLALMQACLTGTQYVYQGQEIGTVNAPKDLYPLENYLDIGSIGHITSIKEKYGADNKEELDKAFDSLAYFARDHGRLPISWTGGKYGGFCNGFGKSEEEVKKPWMEPHPLAKEINVASQLDDPNSVLAHWKKMLAFRREYKDLLVYGDFRDIRPDDEDLFMFVKESSDTFKALVVLNFTTKEQSWTKPSAEELGLREGSEVKLDMITSTHGEEETEALAALEGRVYLVKL